MLRRLPDQLKLPFGLWTREVVQQLIWDSYGIELSRWQVSRYLKSWGYTPQKPISKAFEQKPEQLKNRPLFISVMRQECAVTIRLAEAMHQGKKRQLLKKGQRFSLNTISATSNKGHLQFMIIDERFTSEVFEILLRQMIKYSKQKIFFVMDGHPVHKTNKLNEWLCENEDKIEMFSLPPNRPELNPQEYGNQDVKTNVIGKKRPINKAQMRNLC